MRCVSIGAVLVAVMLAGGNISSVAARLVFTENLSSGVVVMKSAQDAK
jgi:hypothetical protein